MDKVISGDPPWKEDAVSLPSGLQSLVEFFFYLKSGKQFFFVFIVITQFLTILF